MSTGLIKLDELLLGRGGSKIGTPELKLKLPTSVLKHTPIDKLEFDDFSDASPRFHEICVDDAPQIPVDVQEPAPIDMTKATPEEFIAYQEAARAAREAVENAPAYSHWQDLTRDMFYSYHTRDIPHVLDEVDPSVDLHRRILPKAITTDDHAESRRVTRNNAPLAAIATMAFVKRLRELLGDELLEQAKESQEYSDIVDQIEQVMTELEEARDELDFEDDLPEIDWEEGMEPGEGGDGTPTHRLRNVPPEVRDRIRELVRRKRALQAQAYQAAQNMTPMSKAAQRAIEEAAKAAAQAAEDAGNLPSFGSGFGQGEPVYESPEQALTIAEMWANNERLRKMAELFGRVDPEVLYLRSKRVVGGNDEIVDVKFGDNLSRVLPNELALFGSGNPVLELDFLSRFADQELLEFSTIGEEHAGRGPVIIIIDGSYSMQGDRTIWTRAVTMCLLHICRLEKRDFIAIEFADMGECEVWEFPAKQPLDPQLIINMASHFFGGGTAPIQGVQRAEQVMAEAPAFKKADIVMVGDGEAGFGTEDAKIRDRLVGMGVRLFGIAIGEKSSYRYLTEYCGQGVVHVHDFELQDPSQATAALAVQIS